MKPKVGVLITVDDLHFKLEQVAHSLQEKGLENIDSMPISGIVTGSADLEDLDRLRAVPGVQAVELQPTSHAY